MTKKEYNGWFNYETWNAALWIDNDEGSQSYWREQTQECYDAAEASDLYTKDERATLDLRGRLADHFEAQSQEILTQANAQASFWADMLGAALSEVNWHEIAEHFIADLDKEEAATGK